MSEPFFKLDPLPIELPSLSDEDYHLLLSEGLIKRPDWTIRPGGSFEDGTSHINRRCRTCVGKGTFRFWGKDRKTIGTYECRCLDQWTLNAVLSAARIAENLQVLGLDDADFDPGDPTMDVIARWLGQAEEYARRGEGLILSGGSGTGKTFFASLIMRAFMEVGYRAYLTTVGDIRGMTIEGYDDDEIKVRFFQRVKNVDLLVVDQLGNRNEKRSEFEIVTFTELVQHRHSNLRPTIFITQGDREGLIKLYGLRSIFQVMDYHEIVRDSFHPRFRQMVTDEREKKLSRPVVLS